MYKLGFILVIAGLIVSAMLMMIPEFYAPTATPPVEPIVTRTVVRDEHRILELPDDVSAIVRVPRISSSWLPVYQGTGTEDLARGLGHWMNGIPAGGAGNYVLAGHRVTHTEPFKDFPKLRTGDYVYVRTRHMRYTYILEMGGNDLRVNKSAVWVTNNRENKDRSITLITCSETFHTDDRSVVFGHLVSSRLN